MTMFINMNLAFKFCKYKQTLKIEKASRVLGVLQRNLSSWSETVNERVYMGLVCPLAEYATIHAAWSAHTKNRCEQHRKHPKKSCQICLWRLRPCQQCTVTSMTTELGWSSLQSRRTVHELTLFCKINRGQLSCSPPPPPFPELVPTERRIN